MTPIRLTVVMTHPVQYLAPLWRALAARSDVDPTVLYVTEPTARQQGVGFARPFHWDLPLREGYRSRLVRAARESDDVSSSRPFRLDADGLPAALAATEPEVVLVPGWHSLALLRAIAWCRRHGVPMLYRGDSTLASGPPRRARLRRLAWSLRTRALLGLYDGHLVVGARSREYLIAMGTTVQRLYDSPHAVDGAAFAAAAAPHQTDDGREAARAAFGLPPSSGGFVALYVGKLLPSKRVADLVRAAARAAPRFTLLVVGSGPPDEEQSLRALAAQLGVDARFAGFLQPAELGRAYAAADVLVLPSARETWGLVVNEALATGLPCIVTDTVGCAPDLVEAKGEEPSTGAVYPVGDVASLAACLSALARRLGRGEDLAERCRRRSEAHSLRAAAGGIAAGCRAVVRRDVAPQPRGPRVVACCGAMVAFSGHERMTFEVLRVLREGGAQVHCIVNTWANERIVHEAEAIGASWSTGFYWHALSRHARSPRRLARMLEDILRTSAGLLGDAVRLRATHVLVPEFLTALRNAPALALLRAVGVRVIVNLGNAPTQGRAYRLLWTYVVDPIVDTVVGNSRFTLAELAHQGRIGRKGALIYNTAPRRAERSPSGEIERAPGRVIYVGQIIPEKGVDLLVEAVALLIARGRDVELVVVGDIDGWTLPEYAAHRRRLRARASAPDLAGRVRFLGWREDVPALLAGAAVHCCPSRISIKEAFGLVNLEAKLAGTPSVTTRSGALPELIEHGRDGWLCDETPASLADGIERFLLDEACRARAGAAARSSAARFSPERFAGAWRALVGLS